MYSAGSFEAKFSTLKARRAVALHIQGLTTPAGHSHAARANRGKIGKIRPNPAAIHPAPAPPEYKMKGAFHAPGLDPAPALEPIQHAQDQIVGGVVVDIDLDAIRKPSDLRAAEIEVPIAGLEPPMLGELE